MIKRFTPGQRVEVIDDEAFPEMAGRKGTVARIKMSGQEAWINMDEPHDHSPFPSNDPRGKHRCYYKDELKQEAEVKT